jgi:uncharacterized repeat protein (TIGR01451 family)
MRHQKLFLFAVCLSVLITGFPANILGTDFAAAKSYPVGTGPTVIVAGDFNGDGKMDIAVAINASGDVSILLNNGDGTFKPAMNSPTGTSPQQMVVGDFNGDGKLDLVVTNFNYGVFVLLGKGDGTFQAATKLQADPLPESIAVADLNEDKKLDLLLGDHVSPGVTVLLGNGDGTFHASSTALSSTAGPARALAVGDFNGDKHADVVTANLTGPTTVVFLLPGKGDGTFDTPHQITSFPEINQDAPRLLIGDFTGNGKLDLMLRFEVKRRITCPPWPPSTPPCYAFSHNGSLFSGNGDGSFSDGTVVFSNFPTGAPTGGIVAGGDFNVDSKQDLIVDDGGSPLLFLGHGDGTFLSGFALPHLWAGPEWSFVVADFNGDNLPDLAISAFWNDAVVVILNTSPTSGADLAVTLSPPPANVVIGAGNFQYSATIVNEGPQDATGVALKESLPSSLKFVSATPSQGTCAGTTTITCDLGAMADPSSATVSFTVTPTAAGTFTDALHVAGSQADLNSKNDTASFTVTVLVPADIAVSGNSSVTTAATGDKVTYTIQVANAGPGPATNVVLTDSISDGNLAMTALTTSQGSCTPTPGNITCTIGTINSGAKVNISFVFTMGPSEVVANGLSLTSDTPDINTADNSLVLNVNVNPANLAVIQNAAPTTVFAGAQTLFTISVNNNGPAQATNVVLNDTLPGGATIGSVQASQGTCAAPVNGAMSCTLGTLAASASATISFGATSSTGGTETNNVSVSSDQVDPDSSNNSANLDVAVQDFSITPEKQSLTVARGGSGSEVLTFGGQGGFAGNLDLKCAVSGPAPAPTCGISPSTVAAASTATLTISAALITASLAPSSNSQPFAAGTFAFVLPFAVFGLIAARNSSKNRRGLWLLCILAIAMSTMSAACGGGSSGPSIPQTYTITVTATTTPSGIQHSTSIHVTVQ